MVLLLFEKEKSKKKKKDMTDTRTYAIVAHGNQTYGKHPYVVHLDEVVTLVSYDSLAMKVAYLHDVLEDTKITYEEIEENFGHDVAVSVQCITDPSGPNRKERKKKLHKKLRALDHTQNKSYRAALLVKVADRLANVRACIRNKNDKLLKTYCQEHDQFQKAVRRKGFGADLWDNLNEIILKSKKEKEVK